MSGRNSSGLSASNVIESVFENTEFLVLNSSADLLNERVLVDSDYTEPNSESPGFITIDFSAITSGTYWVNPFSVNQVPIQYPLSTIAGDGLSYLVELRNGPFPVSVTIVSVSITQKSGNTQSFVINLPTERLPSDRLVIIVGDNQAVLGATNLIVPGTWSSRANIAPGGAMSAMVIEHLVDGTESDILGGNTITVTSTNAAGKVARIWLIRDSEPNLSTHPLQIESRQVGTSGTTADPFALSPLTGIANYLWITAIVTDNTGGVTYPLTFPAGFLNTGSDFQPTINVGIAFGDLAERNDTKDPSAFTVTTSSTHAAFTIAIPPRLSGAINSDAATEFSADTNFANNFNAARPPRAWAWADFFEQAASGLDYTPLHTAGLFPTFTLPATRISENSSTTHTISHCGISTYESVVMFVQTGRDTTISTPADWTQLATINTTSNRMSLFRFNSGAIAGSISFTLGAASTLLARFVRIQDCDLVTAFATQTFSDDTGTAATTDPPTISPSWSTTLPANNLYIIGFGLQAETTDITGLPTSYTDGGNDEITSANAALDQTLGLYTRKVRGTTENPSAFSHTASDSLGIILAIPPIPAGSVKVATESAGEAVVLTKRVSFAAGGGGVADDITIYNANCPGTFRIIDATVTISTGIALSVVTVRDTSGGGGAALSSTLVSAIAGTVRNNDTVTRALALNSSVFLRRSDNGVAGEIILSLVKT